jgi:excisionase family DNA binding protein
MTPRLVSIEEAARQLGVHPLTIRRLFNRGELPTVRVGRRRLIPQEAIDAYIRAHTEVAVDPVAQALEEAGDG